MTNRFLRVRTAVLLCGFSALILLLGGLFRVRSGQWLPRPADLARLTADPTLATADTAREVPLRIGPHPRPVLAVRPEDRGWVGQRIRPFDRRHNQMGLCLHVLRVHGLTARFTEGDLPSSAAILDLLTDAEAGRQYFGNPPFIRTRSGVRYPTVLRNAPAPSGAWESHRDQVLGAFGELGIPLTQPLRFADTTLSVREVLRDSIANYHARQDELMWTGLGYALYLPPRRGWLNRFGERASFDELVTALLDRPLDKSSCAGTHLLYTLTVLARADQQQPVLTDPIRERLWQRLREALAVALATQEPDGSWALDWNKALLPEAKGPREAPDVNNLPDRLLTTGHLAEWLLYLPEELAVPDSCLRRAGSWLYERLRVATPDDILRDFCPYTHAARVVLLVMYTPEESSPHPAGAR